MIKACLLRKEIIFVLLLYCELDLYTDTFLHAIYLRGKLNTTILHQLKSAIG